MKINKVNMINVSEWDKLVKDTYKRPYCFQQQDGCKDRGTFPITVPEFADDYENDTVPEEVNHEEMGVSFKAWLNRDPKSPLKDEEEGSDTEQWEIDMWWDRNFYPNIQMIANDLQERGLLDAGDYVINIDW
jgi:hypothetical protein